MSISSHVATSSVHVTLCAQRVTDSRGRPTVQVTATLGAVKAVGDVPAGASKGQDEARVVSVEQAIEHIHHVLAPLVVQAQLDLTQPSALRALDERMAAAAGESYVKLGANAVLPVSRALWRLGALLSDEPLWSMLRRAAPALYSGQRTIFYMNIFNGGLHALRSKEGEQLGRDRIDIQEIMVAPVRAQTYAEALRIGEAIDKSLDQELHEHYPAENISRADEAGFSVRSLGDSDRAIAHVISAIERAGYVPGKDVKLALDNAASSFYDKETQVYHFASKTLTSDEMIAWQIALVERYPDILLSIEDGLDENDWQGWSKLSAALKSRGVFTIGDDLFVTQMPRLHRGIKEQAAHAILIKVNQNGSVGGTLDVMEAAHVAGMACIVSHRSGETLDDSIADLAVAGSCIGIKSGDPQPERAFGDPKTWVRRVKYLRMIAIDKEQGHIA